MTDAATLLPPNATDLERALAQLAAEMTAMPVGISDIKIPSRSPAAFLPHLAWEMSVDEWDPAWTEEVKRAVIEASIDVHRHKGTIWAVRRALTAAGLGDAKIVEQYGDKFHDGTIPRDGSRSRARADHWAEYRVILSRPMSVHQSAVARRIIISAAPARSRLKAMDFRTAALLYGSRAPRDGSYTRGIV